MPVGKVRYYDAEKGFGFLSKDEGGEDVYVRASALPDGVTTLKRGQKVEFGVVDGKKGEQALSVRLLEAPPSLSRASRKSPEQMAIGASFLGMLAVAAGLSLSWFQDTPAGPSIVVSAAAIFLAGFALPRRAR